MPIEYFVTDKGSLVCTYAYGKVLAADIVVHEQRVLADARVTAGYRQLFDCRWVSEDADADELLRSLAEAHARHRAIWCKAGDRPQRGRSDSAGPYLTLHHPYP